MRIFPTCPVFSTSVRRWWPCGRVVTALRRATSSCATPQPSSGFVGCSRSASTSPSFYKSTVTGTKRPSADQPLTLGSWYNDKEFLFFCLYLLEHYNDMLFIGGTSVHFMWDLYDDFMNLLFLQWLLCWYCEHVRKLCI